MPRFPTRESDVDSLAQRIISGLRDNAEDFPSPPISVDELDASLNAYTEKVDAVVQAQSAAGVAVDEKAEALEKLTDEMKAVLRYAEDTVNYDGSKLRNLGWNGRKQRSELEPPGQPNALEAKREGPGWVLLEWRKPTYGGRVAAYHVQMQRSGDREWKDVAVCFERMTVLTEQERAVELDYRVVPANKAGVGVPSNVITVVL
jgi:hypothetical protein